LGLNTIVSFCFEDETVDGGLRFWLGRILRIVHRPRTGPKRLIQSRIALKDIPSDLYVSCKWLTPILSNNATVLTTTEYKYSPSSASDLKEVDAKYIVSVVELTFDEVNHLFRLDDGDLRTMVTYIRDATSTLTAPESIAKQRTIEK